MFRSLILQAEKKSVKTSIQVTAKKPSAFRAVSAASGAAYPAAIAESLDKLPFASNLWLSERQMKVIGVAVAPAHKGKGFTSKGKGGITFSLFNADQTTDRAKVETFKGRMVATSALTGEKMIGDVAQALTSSVANFPTNEWLSAKEVEGLALALKPNATPVAVSFKFTDKTELADGKESVAEREVTKMFYNVADVAKPEAVAQAAKMIPMSASSGKAYSKNMVLPLLRAAIANKFTSPFWTTLSGAQAMGLLVKDAKAGVEIAVSSSKTMTFFNAEQTNNAAKVAAHAYKAQFQPRSAMSGSPYPEPTSSALSAASMKNRHKSVFWLTFKQASFLGVEILPGQKPTEVPMSEGSIKVFNADQTSSKETIEAKHIKAKN